MEVMEDFPSVVVQKDEEGAWMVLGLASGNGPTIRIENLEVQFSSILPPTVNSEILSPAVSGAIPPPDPSAVSEIPPPTVSSEINALTADAFSWSTILPPMHMLSGPVDFPSTDSGQLHWTGFGGWGDSASNMSVPSITSGELETADLTAGTDLLPEVWIPITAADSRMRRLWRSGSRRWRRVRESPSIWQSLKRLLARRTRRSRRVEGTESSTTLEIAVAAAAAAAHDWDLEQPGAELSGAAAPTGLPCPPSMTVDALAQHVLEIEDTNVHKLGVRILESLSRVEDNCLKISESVLAIKFLTKMLDVDDENSLPHQATRALANIAKFEDNARRFWQSPSTMKGLVKVLRYRRDVLAQEAAATAFANLASWRYGVKAVFGASGSVDGLVELVKSPTVVAYGRALPHGQTEAARALVSLALSRENKKLLEFPRALAVLAQLVDVSDPLIYEKASIALADLSFTVQNAQKIGESEGFLAILEVLARMLLRSHGGGPHGQNLYMQKMVTITMANLCITEHVQLMVADYPNVISGLFQILEARGPEEQIDTILQVQEGAAMTLGNLALAPDNRRKILLFGPANLANLASLLIQDKSQGAQECAAWAFGNLMKDSEDDPNAVSPAAVLLASVPGVLEGLAQLLALATEAPATGHRWERLYHKNIPRFRILEETARALANLTQAHETHEQMVQIPNMVHGLAMLHRHEYWVPLDCQIHAARALANLSANRGIRNSSIFFELVFTSVVHMVSCEFGDVKGFIQMREFGAMALSSFSVEPSYQWKIVSSSRAMAGLATILSSGTTYLGREQALLAIGNLAFGNSLTKIAVATFPSVVYSLRALLAGPQDSDLPGLARLALRGLQVCLLEDEF